MKRIQEASVTEISVVICTTAHAENFYSPDADLEKIRSVDKSNFKSNPNLGNPTFQLCRQMGGTPELLKMKRNGVWVDADRCILSDGKSFVSGDLLMELFYPET